MDTLLYICFYDFVCIMNLPDVIKPSPETTAAVNWLANNDLKALSFVGLTEYGEATTTQLGHELAERAHPDAFKPVLSYPITFAKAGFAEVREGAGQNTRPANYYTAVNTLGALASIGALLRVSETYDYPLVTALSITASKGQGNAPMNTIQILDGLQKGYSITTMRHPGYKPRENEWITTHSSRLNTLIEIGIIKAEDETIDVRIIDPRYKGSRPFDLLLEGRKGFYKTIELAKALNPNETWTPRQLKELAQQSQFIDESSEADFQDALMRAVSISLPRYSPGVLEKQELKPRHYSLSESYAAMAHDLVKSIVMVDKSSKYASEAREYAVECYYTPDIAFQIASRALQNSPYRKV